MKSVIAAGGLGSRLLPLTLTNNKHLLPIFSKPMIFYPIETLVRAGITEVMLVVSGPFAGNFIPILKNGEDFGLKKLVYAFQSKPDGGIADALALAEEFAEGEPLVLILGDNCADVDLKPHLETFQERLKVSEIPSAQVFLKQVPDPERFGVATVQDNKITKIVEKPTQPESDWAITGVYFYDSHVFSFIKECQPSARGELEITDVNNVYLQKGNLYWAELEGFWRDAGTFETLFEANSYWAHK